LRQNRLLFPYTIWMVFFIVFPLFLVLFYSVTDGSGGEFRFSLSNFVRFLDPIYLKVLFRSVKLAFFCTAICLLSGYPLAAILAGRTMKKKGVLIFLFVIPMWMNFLLRTYALMTLLEKNGILNTLLLRLGIRAISLLYTDEAVVLGMVYNFLPFMVLPIYSSLTKIDRKLIEAAEDLGATPGIVFRKITFPLILPGVISGITMVFMPAVTTFVISRLLGGGQYTLIGNLVEQQFLYTGDWGFGSAISIIIMIFILVTMRFVSRYDREHEGAGLW